MYAGVMPLKDKAIQRFQLFDELYVMLCSYHLNYFTDVETPERQSNFGLSMIFFLGLYFCFHVSLVFIQSFIYLLRLLYYKWLQRYEIFRRRPKPKETSEER